MPTKLPLPLEGPAVARLGLDLNQTVRNKDLLLLLSNEQPGLHSPQHSRLRQAAKQCGLTMNRFARLCVIRGIQSVERRYLGMTDASYYVDTFRVIRKWLAEAVRPQNSTCENRLLDAVNELTIVVETLHEDLQREAARPRGGSGPPYA